MVLLLFEDLSTLLVYKNSFQFYWALLMLQKSPIYQHFLEYRVLVSVNARTYKIWVIENQLRSNISNRLNLIDTPSLSVILLGVGTDSGWGFGQTVTDGGF